MTAAYTIPTDPDDPEAAALELLVQLPLRNVQTNFAAHGMTPDFGPLTAALQQFSTALETAGTFRGMTWHDARIVAAAIQYDLLADWQRPATRMFQRALDILRGRDTEAWDDRARAADALRSAAMIYPLLR